jgi:hypothetical protein
MTGPWRCDRPGAEPLFFATEDEANAAILDPKAAHVVWFDAFDYELHNQTPSEARRRRKEAS